MIVPFNQSPRQARGVPSPITPPPDVFLAMAAAQMHAQGRLFEPESKAPDLYETRPQASLGGRSIVETNNPELGPTDVELRNRMNRFEQQNRNR